MANNMIQVPDTSTYLTEGSVVMFPDGSETKWLVKYGWYSYSGTTVFGWYYSSISAGEIKPLTEASLIDIIIISGAFIPDWPCPTPPFPPVPPCPPFPPLPPGPGPTPEKPAFISEEEKERYDAAFITFATIEARDELTLNNDIPDGKIIRVNNAGDDEVGYFQWNSDAQEWDPWEAPSVTSVSADDKILGIDNSGALYSTLAASLQIDAEDQTAEINITGKDGTQVTTVDVTPLIPRWRVVTTE